MRRKLYILLLRVLPICAAATLSSPAFAQSYDGQWQGNYRCWPYSKFGLGPFSWSIRFEIKNGSITGAHSFISFIDRGPETAAFSGTIGTDGAIKIDVLASHFHQHLVGGVLSPTQVNLTGAMLGGNNEPIRDCQLVMALSRPSAATKTSPPSPTTTPTVPRPPSVTTNMPPASPATPPPPQQAPGNTPSPSTAPPPPAQQTSSVSIDQALLDKLIEPGEQQFWKPWLASMPIQEKEFCQIINDFDNDLKKARDDKNEIEFDVKYKQRISDLLNLTQGGPFQGWIFQYREVKQGSGNSATVSFKPPCNLLPNCEGNGRPPPFSGLLSKDSQYFRELEKLETGSAILSSGTLPSLSDGNPEPALYCKSDRLFVVTLQSVFKLIQPGSH